MVTRLPRRKSSSFRQPISQARLCLELLEDRSLLDAAAVPELLVTLKTGQLQTVPVQTGVSVDQALAAWQAKPDVLAAEVNQIVSVAVIPNDPSFGSLWGLHNTGQSGGVVDADIDAPEAWDSYTGGPNKTVGIIDTGMDYTHPDLYLNVWINQGEIPAAIRANRYRGVVAQYNFAAADMTGIELGSYTYSKLVKGHYTRLPFKAGN